MHKYRQVNADEINAKQREYYHRHKDKRKVNKIGNVGNIRRICLESGLSEDIADVIAVDGIALDKKMRERGMVW